MFNLDLTHFTLAQQPLPSTPDMSEGPSSTMTSPGGPGGPGPNSGGGTAAAPGGSNFMLIFIVLIVAMLVFTMWSSRRDRRKREAMISAVKKHDRVQTIGGVIGSVVEVKPDTIVLKVDESSNTRITFARSAVQQVLNATPEFGAKAES